MTYRKLTYLRIIKRLSKWTTICEPNKGQSPLLLLSTIVTSIFYKLPINRSKE